MAKTRQQKEQELTVLSEKLDRSKGVVFARYMGLSVNEVQELRRELRKEENEMVVAKKSLVGLMLEKAGQSKDQTAHMDGAVAVVFGYKDEVSPAKVLATFAKKHELVGFHGGLLEGNYISIEQVTALAKLPSRQELLAKMVGSMKAPISGFANVLGGNLRGLVQVLNQISEKKAA
ncbi:MAG: 50S ribosomal protein L10 [Candidatus Kerfeldbacteria bacterium]|nr:50S ribosomal protein L10 [Candidatus Kerfeldbacteria bacterium]